MVVHVIDFQKASSTRNPFNPLGKDLRRWLNQELEQAIASPTVDSVVLYGGDGGSFSVGADLTEFAQFMKSANKDDTDDDSLNVPNLLELITLVEQSPKPIVAAIAGHALGGGLELALACHYRVAHDRSQLGLPEVQVGVIPGAGGTQRLPRLIGVEPALEMIVTGKPVSAKRALQLGLVDAIPQQPSQSVLECALKWAQWAALMPLENRRVGEMNRFNHEKAVTSACDVISKTLPPVERGGEGVHAAVKAVRACYLPLAQAMQVEGELFWNMLLSAQGQARRHAAFMAVQSAQKFIEPSSSPSHHVLLGKTASTKIMVGVVGAGTMGSGIAQVLLQSGFIVYLLDSVQPALDKGVQRIRETLQQYVQQGRLDKSKAKQLQQALIPTANLSDLAKCVLVVEAVIENMQVKQDIFASLEKVTHPDCLLLSNTSTLDIDQMAVVLNPSRQALFAGWHFFSPAPVMKLVEIVRGRHTSSSTVMLLQALTKRIGKIGVVVGNCHGFVGNRMLHPYTSEMVLVLTEPGAASVASIDKALLAFGMAIGPFQMSDLAGNDIGYYIRRERGWVRDEKDHTNLAELQRRRPSRYTELADDMVTRLGRLGQKVGKVSSAFAF
jgi:3-hydroxyacyl-CoA dehydrogenase/enoyl-CoA hydratase/carnithine racemase